LIIVQASRSTSGLEYRGEIFSQHVETSSIEEETVYRIRSFQTERLILEGGDGFGEPSVVSP